MRHLSRRDQLLLLAGMGLWAVCFVLHLGLQLRGELGWLPVSVEATPEGPRVVSFWSDGDAAASGLRIGDRVLAVGVRELAPGAGALAFVTAAYEQAQGLEVPVRVRRGGAIETVAVPLSPIASRWAATLVSAVFACIGALVLVRARGSRAARIAFLALVAYALHWTYFFGGSQAQTLAAVAVLGGSLSLTFPLAIRVVTIFPLEVARDDPARRWLPGVLAVAGVAVTSWAFGWPFPAKVGLLLNLTASVAFLAWAALEITWSYQRASADGRRQVKWVALGFYLTLAPMAVTAFAAVLRPDWWRVYEASAVAAIAIPICLLVAITRDRLFDIDGAITRAASYTAVSVLLLAGALLLAPRAAEATGAWIEPRVAEPAFAVAMAGVILWGRHRLEPRLEAWFFRERKDLERGARELRDLLGRCEKPKEILELLGKRLGELLDPTCLAIYGAADSAFATLYAKGPAIAPAFSAESRLVQALELAEGPLPIARVRRVLQAGGAESESWAALETMGVELILPLHSDAGLEAFVCFGDKRSGDVFRDADLAQLDAIAVRCREAFGSFDRAAVEAGQREMIQSLERYVPAAVTRQLEDGDSSVSGVVDVSVLFVDIRGYTSLSEARTPDAIFALVSEYTKGVSRIVAEYGGAVVDFSGDGLMAVFGAPTPLAEKEARAVAAARAMLEAVEPIERPDGAAQGPVRVGIGIATGEGHVGTIESAERAIWCVLGNTTNLAARLQSMTRTLDALVLVDEETKRRSGDDGFTPVGPTSVRGRNEPVSLFAIHEPDGSDRTVQGATSGG